MKSEIELLRQAVDDAFKGLESSLALNKAQAERQAKPLSDEEIQVLINDVPDYDIGIYELFQFARAIEERHGIK